jgi:hypothetical protein
MRVDLKGAYLMHQTMVSMQKSRPSPAPISRLLIEIVKTETRYDAAGVQDNFDFRRIGLYV